MIYFVLNGLSRNPRELTTSFSEGNVTITYFDALITFDWTLARQRKASFLGLILSCTMLDDFRIEHNDNLCSVKDGKDTFTRANHIGSQSCTMVLMCTQGIGQISSNTKIRLICGR